MNCRAAALLPLLLFGCDSGAPITDGPVPLDRLRPENTAYVSNSTIEDPEVGTVGTQGGWDALYIRLKGNQIPAPTEGPSLRFQDSTLVYVAMGMYPNASRTIILDSAAFDGGVLVIHSTVTITTGCAVASVAVRPVDVAQVPRWGGSVRFVHQLHEVTC